jgi:predicted Holliday junction resolvase-like endonuclease
LTFLKYYQETKRIYGICPCCGEPFRLSDATVFTRGRPPKTAFDDLAKAWSDLREAEERFSTRQAKIQEASRSAGRARAKRHLADIAPFFASHQIQPEDVKVLFDPVDYIAFCGLGDRECRSVDFIDRPPDSKGREVVQKSLHAAIRNGRVEWRTYRVTAQGTIEPGR